MRIKATPNFKYCIESHTRFMTTDLNMTAPKPSYMILLQYHLFQSTVQLKRY